ncbi:putative ABC transport system permease protein [Anaerobacterium chartisolvens]|uniref:Putative ABC transport system permease protein n=1 Tax=Anaerobacterium chartisolvens TaxID=1297424 RepID=A0A369AS91_9FIRM|nr:ABC transporter permease [Anaerobacterium chartisolvens]RCX12219.1 putative ABC transport system permease protein [Anaerobacterium chartisolvens]
MNFSESFRQAIDSLRANKLRSILTMIGIIMGVFSVITILAVGNATQGYIDSQFEKLGANLITINYRPSDGYKSSEALQFSDMDVVRKVAPEIKNIATYIQNYGTVRVGSETRSSYIFGVTPQLRNIDPKEMEIGRYISDMDISTKAKVALVDANFALRYFKRVDIIGETINFRTSWGAMSLKVVGVSKIGDDLLDSMMSSESFPAQIYIPITTLQEFLFNDKTLNNIMVTLTDKEKTKSVSDRIVTALEMKHGAKDVYFASNSDDEQKIFSSITGVISAVLLIIAVITLIVGGIGIINILLVSVTERIREIGIRKALGARKKDIVMQFITESIMMTGLSGLVGILLGMLAGAVISSQMKIPQVVDIKIITMAFLGSVALGLMFGVYPAKRAADLDPIESLRYE